MKSLISYSLLAAMAATGVLSAAEATTIPVGYVTKVLAPNQFNLVGVTLHQPVVSTGILDAADATSVTDTGVNFATIITGGTYILELPNGIIQEVTVGDASGKITTPENISASVVSGTTTYKLRKAATVSDIFGPTNSVGLTASPDGDVAVADKILIVNQSNAFNTVIYINDGAGTQGWFDDQGNPAANAVLSYADGFFVQRVAGAGPINLTISGEVKAAPTRGALATGFNYVSAVSPAGLTLATSGLQNFISASQDGDAASSDNVLVQNADGSYKTYLYINVPGTAVGWFDDQGNAADTASLDTGFLLLNRAGVKPYTVTNSYSAQ